MSSIADRQKEHDGCPYMAVLIEHEDGPWYFCNKCGWGEEASPVNEASDDWTACPFCSADHDLTPLCDEATDG